MENLLKKVKELLKNMNDFQKKLSYIDSVRDDADKIHKMQEAIDKSDNFWKVFNEFNENFNNYKELYSETNKRIETINITVLHAVHDYDLAHGYADSRLSVFFIIDLIYIELIKVIGEKAIKIKQDTQDAIESLSSGD